MSDFSFKIYNSSSALPEDWDDLAAQNIFLSTQYLYVLEKASPKNMKCHFIALYQNKKLCGIALAQYIDLKCINTFVKEKRFSIGDYLLKKWSSDILILGNNTLTGQNAFILNDLISDAEALQLFSGALKELKDIYKRQCISVNLIVIKDFNQLDIPNFNTDHYKGFHRFVTQPNMILDVKENWKSINDYVGDLTKKYRAQYNRARTKAVDIQKRKLSVEGIGSLEARIHELYMNVAGNVSFNTFYLPQNHFEIFKDQLKKNFVLTGYFLNEQLISFSTIIQNGNDADTYFLGYDKNLQKEKMLYLNMLYDMLEYAITERFSKVIFARSAMEIKSSVGAKPESVYGMIKHTNPLLNIFMERLFLYFEPKVTWKMRNPFH